MANLSLKHIYKVYPNGVKAVNDFNMEIEDKEFIVFVGPSGCGKSTTLRMIAGLEDITAGELSIGDLVVNDMEPKDRDIAMVFQNYALYPHMTVYENIAFGLRLRRVPRDEAHPNGKFTKEEINARVLEAAEILGITEYLGRKPKEMSGGQRQRVSLGRAIVREPKVMLLDEPLSNLDAKLRTQMRAEISKLHKKLNTTFIYVTHDQVEAMTMGTRIVVMKNGFIQQIDTPKNLYNYPENKFVAGFIGTPQMNFFEGTMKREGDSVRIRFAYSEVEVTVPYSYFYKARPDYLNGEKQVIFGLRAENISLSPEAVKNSPAVIRFKVSHKEELGSETLVYGDINMEGDGYVESSTRIIVKCGEDVDCLPGELVEAALDLDHMHIFDKETEESILPRIPRYNYLQAEVKGGKLHFLGEETELPPAISCEDGEYELLLPSDAICSGGSIRAKLVSSEVIGNRTLSSLEVGGTRLFSVALTEGDAEGIHIDMKKIALLRNGEEVVRPMPLTATFGGSLKKCKVTEEVEKNGKTVQGKVVRFFLNIEGVDFPAPERISAKLISALSARKAFDTQLRYECSSYGLFVTESGIPAKVLRIADYGTEKFAVCAIGEREVYLKTETELEGEIFLTPDFETLSIIQADLDIRIV